MENMFTENMKMAELIFANPKLLLVFSHFNMGLGFGERSVGEVCRQNGIAPLFFLLICKIYADNEYVPSNEDMKSVNINDLFSYLKKSHLYYIEEKIPHIERHLDIIIKSCDKKYGDLIGRFFGEYKVEMLKHFDYEEETVFPYIKSLCEKKNSGAYSISDFKRKHNNIDEKLGDLMNILVKYLPSGGFEMERIEISFDIIQLSQDLLSHSLVEDRLLIPFVELMEDGSIN